MSARVTFFAAFIFSLVMIVGCGGSGGNGVTNGDSSVRGVVTIEDGIVTARLHPKMEALDFVLSLLQPSIAYAQESTEGTPLPGATVELYDSTGNLVGSTTTDANGEFEFVGVLAGDYSLLVTEASIEPVTIAGVTVLAGDTAVVSGRVTAEGSEASVEYEVETCGIVGDNQAQLSHATNIADAAEVTVEEVIALREQGCMGWGAIANSLDVHPRVIGVGNAHATGGGRVTTENPGNGNGKPENPGNGKPENTGNGSGKPENPGSSNGNGKPENPGNSNK